MITISVMYSIYSRMYKARIDTAKTDLQDLYASHRNVVKALIPYENVLKENDITIEDLNDGIFKEIPITFSNENKVIHILYTNVKNSYNTIHYKRKDFEKLNKDFLKKDVFYKVVKTSLKLLCKAMVYEKYTFRDSRIGKFRIVHRYLKNAINWEESEKNKERLKKEGKFTEGCKWVITGETTYLIPEWSRENLFAQREIRSFEYKVPKSDYGIIGMLASLQKTTTMMDLLAFPPYREEKLLEKIKDRKR